MSDTQKNRPYENQRVTGSWTVRAVPSGGYLTSRKAWGAAADAAIFPTVRAAKAALHDAFPGATVVIERSYGHEEHVNRSADPRAR